MFPAQRKGVQGAETVYEALEYPEILERSDTDPVTKHHSWAVPRCIRGRGGAWQEGH